MIIIIHHITNFHKLFEFSISFDVAIILNLPPILTAVIENRLYIPACKIVKAALTSVFV